jgi:hypothetical protein
MLPGWRAGGCLRYGCERCRRIVHFADEPSPRDPARSEIDGEQLEHGAADTGREPEQVVPPGAVTGWRGRVKKLERSFRLDDLRDDATVSVPA